MPVCWFCGMETDRVYNCPQCRQDFCEVHRDPANHDCTGVPVANPLAAPPPDAGNSVLQPTMVLEGSVIPPYQPPLQSPPATTGSAPAQPVSYSSSSSVSQVATDGSYVWHREDKPPEDAFDPDSGVEIKGILWPKGSEAAHFFIALGLIFGLALTIFLSWKQQGFPDALLPWQGVLLLALFYTSGFFLHELGHRQVARRHNLPTKFRLFTFGVSLTLVGFFTPLKIGFPGAVLVVGLEEISDRTGHCKLAGPMVNLVLGGSLFALSLLPALRAPYNFLFCMGAFFNFQLGLFNLMPVGPLDGRNILKWKPAVWGIMVAAMASLFIVTLVIYSSPVYAESIYHLSEALFP
ncbi:MAG: AN1-type zinc finger domain-containing protein [Promethearchaeota archaeon]